MSVNGVMFNDDDLCDQTEMTEETDEMDDYYYDDDNEQTVMTEEMEKRLGDVICIAPWTELDLGGEF